MQPQFPPENEQVAVVVVPAVLLAAIEVCNVVHVSALSVTVPPPANAPTQAGVNTRVAFVVVITLLVCVPLANDTVPVEFPVADVQAPLQAATVPKALVSMAAARLPWMQVDSIVQVPSIVPPQAAAAVHEAAVVVLELPQLNEDAPNRTNELRTLV